jgi:hypothetical protein
MENGPRKTPKEEKEERAFCDTISSKSFKSHISNMIPNFPEYISEERSLEGEDEDDGDGSRSEDLNDDEDEDETKISEMNDARKRLDIALYLKTAQ